MATPEAHLPPTVQGVVFGLWAFTLTRSHGWGHTGDSQAAVVKSIGVSSRMSSAKLARAHSDIS